MKFSKTRIAPTPSGFLHLGNLYSFALTAALAEKAGAKLLLRIDDMDAERIEDRYLDDIFDTLHHMGIPWQEGPRDKKDLKQNYSQKLRLPLYNEALDKLAKRGKVFACSCSRKDLEAHGGIYPGTCVHKGLSLEEPGLSWRLDTGSANQIKINNLQSGYRLEQFPKSMQYTVLRRRDALPAYQICSLMDDLHFGIDLIVRGMDLYDSSLVQLYLAELLGEDTFLNTTFFHHELIKNKVGEKLSKSAGSDSVKTLQEQKQSVGSVYEHLAELTGMKGKVKSWRDFLS